MLVRDHYHLSYCTNIHPGKTWEAVFASLEQYALPLKQALSPDKPFGIGLRLSRQASLELGTGERLRQFKAWLNRHDCYVFTMNGFPYGGFHGQRVKDHVHQPDWTTTERLEYTLLLFDQLAELLPEGMEGGISTSPLSYKPWFEGEPEKREAAFLTGTRHLLEVARHLDEIFQRTGRYLHLDLEPEPDGLLENTDEVLDYYANWLLPSAQDAFAGHMEGPAIDQLVRRHLTICYDVCHYAVEFEEPRDAFLRMREAGIKVGKIQISAALKAMLPEDDEGRQSIAQALSPFNESTYLHQVIEKKENGELQQFPDLPEALATLGDRGGREWRCHFHVPLFVEAFGLLSSTQDEILKVLEIARREPLTRHLEVETYTWDVLPPELRLDLKDSIEREFRWVKDRL